MCEKQREDNRGEGREEEKEKGTLPDNWVLWWGLSPFPEIDISLVPILQSWSYQVSRNQRESWLIPMDRHHLPLPSLSEQTGLCFDSSKQVSWEYGKFCKLTCQAIKCSLDFVVTEFFTSFFCSNCGFYKCVHILHRTCVRRMYVCTLIHYLHSSSTSFSPLGCTSKWAEEGLEFMYLQPCGKQTFT